MRALTAVSGVYCDVTMNSGEGDISNNLGSLERRVLRQVARDDEIKHCFENCF